VTTSEALQVRVSRSAPDARSDFAVGRRGLRVVLDVLAAVERLDSSLAYRYSCRSGLCGTCTVVIDGRAGLACQTPLDPDARRITIAPLGGFPVVRDLIIDPEPFAERWLAAGSVAAHPASEAAAHLDCISCGACTAACDAWSAERPFLGPAALTRAFVVLANGGGRDGYPSPDLAVAVGPDGCHGIGACTLACPKHLDPSLAIRRLRRLLLFGAGS
jgi:succinate dehydrogenase/fumarate reductase iron-sulfur protein